jgi:ATP-dependent Clp protease protease subunit
MTAEADSDRDRWFTAEEAKDYGFIDSVIEQAAAVREPSKV